MGLPGQYVCVIPSKVLPGAPLIDPENHCRLKAYFAKVKNLGVEERDHSYAGLYTPQNQPGIEGEGF